MNRNALGVFGGSTRMSRAFVSWSRAITYDVFGPYGRLALIFFDELISAAESLPTFVELGSGGEP